MDPNRPISPAVATGDRGQDLPAYVSNGLIGLRVRENPLLGGMCIVSGFVGEHHEKRIEAAAEAPYPLSGEIAVDDLWLGEFPEATELLDQAYDFGSGELTSRFRLHLGGRIVDVEVVTFASRTHPTVVCQQVTVEADGPCDLKVRLRINTTDTRGRMLERLTATPGEDEPVCDGSILWEADGGLGRCGLAMVTNGPDEAERSQDDWDKNGPLSTTYLQRATKGRRFRFTSLVSLIPDAMHRQPQRQAVRLIADAKELGFDELRRRNRAEWADLWKGRIRLVGAEERWQALADAAFFYLTTSIHAASPASTSIFGLATWRNYHHYFGHVMWDIDAFAIPPASLLQPDAARSMLEFRSRGIEAARLNAQMLGYQGLKFPWEAGARHGEEATPGGAAAAAREDHINIHVARAFLHHADATGDGRFLEDKVWPIVSGIADWIVSRVDRTRTGYAIKEGGGIAERAEKDDNDAFTVMGARIILERACDLAERLDRPADPAWRRVAEGLHPPKRADGVIGAHDGYRVDEEKGATPGPLMALFPYWADIDEATAKATLAFYLGLWEDYVGAPMLSALYGTWAAWAGDRALSAKLFEEGYNRFQYGRFLQTLEYRIDKEGGVAAGPFVANMGGFLTGLLFGLPGLRVSPAPVEEWACRPVVLPEGWQAIECDRLWIHGRPARLVARQGADRAELTLGPAP